MATRLYTVGPDARISNVIEGVGAATSSANLVNVTIDLSASLVTGAGGTARTVSKSEVLMALDTIKEYILEKNWPPA